MRKIRLTFFIISLISIISMMGITINGEINRMKNSSEDYKDKLIRFHVLANSDSDEDQELKLKVRDEVIAYLQPKLKNSKDIKESEQIIKNEYENLEKISKQVIKENGYDYDVSISLTYSYFPTKQYSSVVLPHGEYKALKIIIGEGEGKNWWCVMFPPLCFVDEETGILDKETDEKLKKILTKEEYELITNKNSKDATRVKVKFKIVEIIDNISKKRNA